jgi:hypothetical protein
MADAGRRIRRPRTALNSPQDSIKVNVNRPATDGSLLNFSSLNPLVIAIRN